jgi:chitodextrinase
MGVLFIFIPTAFAQAATYYVSTTGSDSNPGNLTQPWRTVQRAATAMMAGDTTYVRGGTYTENFITFARSGTSGNVITLAAYPGETPIIDSGLRATSGRRPVFMIAGVNYITLDGLTIQYGSTANVYISYNTPATHITIQNCTMPMVIQEDNAAHIYMDPGSDNILIQNNYIHDYITGGYSGNAANGIIIFGSQPYSGGMNITIQNNEIYGNLIQAIYYKHSQVSDLASVTIIKNNLIHITGNRSVTLSRDRVQFTNNVIYGGRVGLTLFIAAGPGAANDTYISHNTILNQSGISITDQQYRTIIRDNIISDVTTTQDDRGIGVWHYGAASDTSNTTIDHTLVYSAATTATIFVPGSGFVTVGSLPSSISGRVGNLASTPTFVNAGANNYTLTSSSPGYRAASDGTDMGANIALVGVGNSGPIDTTAPSTPTNLSASAASSSQINLSWTASSDNVGITGYKIYRGGTQIATSSTTTYSDTTLNPSTTYSYTVAAYDAAGNTSVQSGSVSATTQAAQVDTTPPTTPTNLSASAISSSQINLAWAASTDAVGVTGYRVYRAGVLIASPTGTTYSDTALTPSTTYSYTVAAYDVAGNLSGQSSSVSAITLAATATNIVTLSPVSDTYINIDAINNATAATLNTYTWPSNNAANVILMKFDLSSIPSGSTISSAVLNLNLAQSDTSADIAYSISAHKIINKNPVLTGATGYTYDGVTSWTANTCCYTNIPLAQADISIAYDTKSINKTNGWKQWDISTLAQEWLTAPASNYGLLLNSDTSKLADRYRYFTSSESPTNRPYLTVTYSPSSADTTAPTTPTSLTASAFSSTQINLSWTASTDAVGVTGYRIYRGGTQIGTATTNTYSNTGLTASTAYSYTVAAYDAAGNASAQTSGVSATTQSVVSDTTAPTISLTTPTSGSTVSGTTVTLSATASDNTGVSGVQFLLNGSNLGAEDTTSPYSITWDTTSATNGTHTLTATARDAAGNQTTSTGVTVTTANIVVTPDTLAPTTPTSLTTTSISSTQINLSWTASSDNVGVAGYRIYRNGTQITTVTTSSYSNTTLSPSTSYTYSISAYDAAGNASAQSTSTSGSTQSAPVVTATPPPPSPPLTTPNTPPVSGATGSIATTPTPPTTIPTVATPTPPSTPPTSSPLSPATSIAASKALTCRVSSPSSSNKTTSPPPTTPASMALSPNKRLRSISVLEISSAQVPKYPPAMESWDQRPAPLLTPALSEQEPLPPSPPTSLLPRWMPSSPS